MTVLPMNRAAMNAIRKASGRAAPASAPPAGAFRITARTGAIRAADRARQFGRLRMFLASRGLSSPTGAAVGSVVAICRILPGEPGLRRTAGQLGRGCCREGGTGRGSAILAVCPGGTGRLEHP
jgi:hypothetical protein